GFDVVGTHTYADEGAFTVGVNISDVGGSTTSASTTANVADAALTASATPIVATEGVSFSGVVASFTDANPNATAGDYSATINWGDGAITAGTITAGEGNFTVSGSHTYAEEGSYTVTVSIKDAGGSTASANSTATVDDAALSSAGTTVTAFEGAS